MGFECPDRPGRLNVTNCRRDLRMSHQDLEVGDIPRVENEVGRARVPHQVRVDVDVGALAQPLEYLPDPLCPQRLPLVILKDRTAIAFAEVGAQHANSQREQSHAPALVSFTDDIRESLFKIEVLDPESTQLLAAAGRVIQQQE